MHLVVLLSKNATLKRGGGGGINKNFANLHKFIVINWVSHLLMLLVVVTISEIFQAFFAYRKLRVAY